MKLTATTAILVVFLALALIDEGEAGPTCTAADHDGETVAYSNVRGRAPAFLQLRHAAHQTVQAKKIRSEIQVHHNKIQAHLKAVEGLRQQLSSTSGTTTETYHEVTCSDMFSAVEKTATACDGTTNYETSALETCADRVCTAMKTCAAGTYISDSGSTTSDRTCTTCDDGKYSADSNAAECTACSSCSPGTYVATGCSLVSDAACVDCATGKFTTTADEDVCVTHSSCAAGTYISTAGTTTSDNVCTSCAAGTYTDTADQSECKVCEAGTYQNEAGSTSCDGHTACVAGQYLVTSGSTTADYTCTACADGKYTTDGEQATCATHTACAAGTYISTAGDKTSNNVCTTCDSGSYTASDGLTECVACGSGHYQDEAGQTACDPYTSTSCAAGTYVKTAGSTVQDHTCEACEEGKYTDAADQTTCTDHTVCADCTKNAGSTTENAECGTSSVRKRRVTMPIPVPPQWYVSRCASITSPNYAPFVVLPLIPSSAHFLSVSVELVIHSIYVFKHQRKQDDRLELAERFHGT